MITVAIVDDRADVRTGRRAWLERNPGIEVIDISFATALSHGDEFWTRVDVAILDGRDDRLEDRLDMHTDSGAATHTYDRFLGPRVAERIRQSRSANETRIVLISAYARDNDILAQRCYEAGVDYLYTVDELPDSATFLSKIFEPVAGELLQPPSLEHWTRQSLDGRPALNAAIHALEASPAEEQVIFDLPAKRSPGTAHHLRVVRGRLGPLLALRPPSAGGSQRRRPPKREISAWIVRALGYSASASPPRAPDHRRSQNQDPRSRG